MQTQTINNRTELLKEWDKSQFANAKKQILKYLNSRYFETHHSQDATPFWNCKNWQDFDKALGFAYTSTGSFAGYWICNTQLYLDAAHNLTIEGFGQDKNGFVYMWVQDSEENEFYIPIN